jgi:hypothetical protein
MMMTVVIAQGALMEVVLQEVGQMVEKKGLIIV